MQKTVKDARDAIIDGVAAKAVRSLEVEKRGRVPQLLNALATQIVADNPQHIHRGVIPNDVPLSGPACAALDELLREMQNVLTLERAYH